MSLCRFLLTWSVIDYKIPSTLRVMQASEGFRSRNSSRLTYVLERSTRHGNPLKRTRTFTQLGGWEWQIQSHPEPHCSLQEADVILLRLCGLNGIDYFKILDTALLAFSHCIKRSHTEAGTKQTHSAVQLPPSCICMHTPAHGHTHTKSRQQH